MITGLLSFHGSSVALLSAIAAPAPSSAGSRAAPPDTRRLEALFSSHYDFVWRTLRRFGLGHEAAEDGAQQVFMIAARRIEDIAPDRERAFLFGSARRVAADARRKASTRYEVPSETAAGSDVLAPSPDDLEDQRRARVLLNRLLDELPDPLREVLVLFEIEGMTSAEIASLADTPHGTVRSRLRRARELFEAALDREVARGARRTT